MKVGLLAALVFGLWLLDASAQTAAPAQTQTQLVKISLIVTDPSNRIVEDLRKEDIQVFEGDQALPVTFLTKDERPVRCMISLDASGSMKSLMGLGITVAKALIENKRSDDEIAITSFISSDKVWSIQDFTANKSELLGSLKNVSVEQGVSAVVDGIYTSTEAVADYQPDDDKARLAVVIISDGEDRNSYYKIEKLVDLLRKNDVQLFIIGIVTQLDKESFFIRPSVQERAEKLLQLLADESAGRVFFPRNKEELIEATEQIYLSLNSPYVIGFERQSKPGEKGFRKVKVSLVRTPNSPKLKVITRGRFYVGPREPRKVKKD